MRVGLFFLVLFCLFVLQLLQSWMLQALRSQNGVFYLSLSGLST